METLTAAPQVLWLEAVTPAARGLVGPRHLRLAELIRELAELGIRAPAGFVVTAHTCAACLLEAGVAGEIRLAESRIRRGVATAAEESAALTRHLERLRAPAVLADALWAGYVGLAARCGTAPPLMLSAALLTPGLGAQRLPAVERRIVAPEPEALAQAAWQCCATLVSERMLAWRATRADAGTPVLSIAVRALPRADVGAAGALYTFDPTHGFRDALTITAQWGLPIGLVGSRAQPDRYRVFRPLLHRGDLLPIISRERGVKKQKVVLDGHGAPQLVDASPAERAALVLRNDDLLQLARWGDMLARRHERPLACEWLRDGVTGEFYLTHVRPAPLPIRPVPWQVPAGPPPLRPILLQTANPREAFQCQGLPLAGIGPVRLAAVVGSVIGMPLMSLLRSGAGHGKARRRIERVTAGYSSPTEFLLEQVVDALAQLAAAFHPRPVIVQLSGERPAAGLPNPTHPPPGASMPGTARTLALEVQAVRRARAEVGLENVAVMLPESDSVAGLWGWVTALRAAGLGDDEGPLALHAPLRAGLELHGLEPLADACDTLWLELRGASGTGADALSPELSEAIRTIQARGARVGVWGAALADAPTLARLVDQGVNAFSVCPGDLPEVLARLRPGGP